jgi:hypothetical protein
MSDSVEENLRRLQEENARAEQARQAAARAEEARIARLAAQQRQQDEADRREAEARALITIKLAGVTILGMEPQNLQTF